MTVLETRILSSGPFGTPLLNTKGPKPKSDRPNGSCSPVSFEPGNDIKEIKVSSDYFCKS